MERKTIFLTSFHPLISRNILMSGLVERIAQDHEVVIFVPLQKEEYFKERFGAPHVTIRGVVTDLDAHDLLFRRIFLSCTNTADLFIKKRVEFYRDRKLFSYLASIIPAMLFGRMKWCIQFLRIVDERTAKKGRFGALFDEYHPDLVMSADVQNEIDISFLREAKTRGIRTVAMVRSWDNLTSKGIIRFIPDTLVVHNELVKEEAIHYSFIDPKIISVIGIPHYDRYKKAYNTFHDSSSSTQKNERDTFFASLQFDSQKKLILFAPFGDRYIRGNRTDLCILELLSEFNLNILVRLPPTDTVNFEGFKTRKATVRFYESGMSSGKGGKKVNEISNADEEHLIQSLLHANLVVTGQSTIAIDAAAFDKPTLIAAFDHEPRVYWDSVVRYFDYEYYRKLRERSGIRMAWNPEALRDLVKNYLGNPDLDRAVRARIVHDQLYRFDGKSSERLESILLTSFHGH